jgi:hypothetical protein
MSCLVPFCRKDCSTLPLDAEVYRASGRVPCEVCGKDIDRHPSFAYPSGMGQLLSDLRRELLAHMNIPFTCDYCKAECSAHESREACPNCGASLREPRSRAKWMVIAAGLLLAHLTTRGVQ